MMTSKKRLFLYGLVAATLVLAGGALSQEGADDSEPEPAPPMTFRWEPGLGTPPVRYDVEIRTGGMLSDDITEREVDTEEITFDVRWGTPYEVRVRGVNAQGEVGPWSIWSLVYDREYKEPELGVKENPEPK